MLLSILIPTLEQRAESFQFIRNKLQQQISGNRLEHEVEILDLVDRGELPTGTKRNLLLERARGEFVVSVDDDDDVHERYVPLIVETLRASPHVDCIGIVGEIRFQGGYPRRFIYSTRYPEYRTQAGVYQRPPHHLNPIRREIASRYQFEPITISEDADWALRLSRDGALRQEAFLDEVIYFYRCRRAWAYQWMVDRTEFIRHPLGLQRVNWLRVRRWWNGPGSAVGGGDTVNRKS